MDHQRKSIGEFLRKRRSTLSPKQLGLPEGHTRRRTPGLRREEVATLADVSLTWYTWLEQGREVSASPDVLERIADALCLTSAEREYLYLLTGRYALPEQESPEQELTPAFREWMDHTPYPFLVIGARNRVVAWNRIACDVLTDYSVIPPERREALRLVFQDPDFRAKTVNWEHVSKVSLSFFRKMYDRFAHQSWYSMLVSDIRKESPEFVDWWSLHEVADKNGLQIEIQHPEMGLLKFEIITFNQINDLEHLMSCIYAPIPGTGTLEKLIEVSNLGIAPVARS